eukprot:CAMPEP_0182503524 /NCGR_PEP_ID=MMETSP1321-20130603/15461_1 /TAXON_ID=91990 /ORGANISM="Bolidomonas sp., Strain RCC1657" /LENGTH=451 /DNA_ID=CAMNT_0024708699 /DNA_START=44 /DNA_END=1399 /DNA_ORIENTATION=+
MSKTDNPMRHLFQSYTSHYSLPPSTIPSLTFSHVCPLNPTCTLEQSFLMKEDKVYVELLIPPSPSSIDQLESDVNYFKSMKSLLTQTGDKDVVFECRGEGEGQKVISCRVKAHGFIVKRCKWLKMKIEEEEKRRNDEGSPSQNPTIIVEDETNATTTTTPSAPTSTTTTTTSTPPPITINLPNVSPSAFKIFLEYLYTNRVPQLGYDAHFGTTIQPTLAELDPDVAIRLGGGGADAVMEDSFLNGPNTYWHTDKKENSSNPYPPNRDSWPHSGHCTLSMPLVLGVLHLSVSSRSPLLSRMCEFAALSVLSHNPSTRDLISCVKACVASRKKGSPQTLLTEKSVSLLLERNSWKQAKAAISNMDVRLQSDFCSLLMKNVAVRLPPLLPSNALSRVTSVKSFSDSLTEAETAERNSQRKQNIFTANREVNRGCDIGERARREYYREGGENEEE